MRSKSSEQFSKLRAEHYKSGISKHTDNPEFVPKNLQSPHARIEL